MSFSLETLTESLNYGDLPETWRVPAEERFSATKTLYDYQTDALRKAARALYLYYGREHDWHSGEGPAVTDERKQCFYRLYGDAGSEIPAVKQYESRADRNNKKENPVFRIIGDYIRPVGEEIPYRHLINRMCFWMATGSGKTLVMIKLIAYLHFLIRHREIPPHNILILAPSEHFLKQIRETVAEFNSGDVYIQLVPLREMHRHRQVRIGETVTVYYHRSDNISDVQKEALTDYRTYENDGRWYVLLDEAHKGGKEDSRRQAYYKVMVREGFLFNFSATFTEPEDIATTVKQYNLGNFVRNGHGKNIYLNESEYEAFSTRAEEISDDERRVIVLKSLLTLAHVSHRVKALRTDTGFEKLYHLPLMLTLVNSVNTDIENERNDLWAFFQTLRDIAGGEIERTLFKRAKTELLADWRKTELLFHEDGGETIAKHETAVADMTVADLREAVFLSRDKAALQFVRSGDNKELALQMKNAAAPFALIRIGNTAKWRNQLLVGYEETQALQEKSFFDGLETSPITILMGSRSFFESWDSNRPNVINFINIGGFDAKKFVVQSIGRGVRIETLPGKRRRFDFLKAELTEAEQTAIQNSGLSILPPETLFLFATNRKAVKSVLEGLAGEKRQTFETLAGFEKSAIPMVGETAMPLLIPAYRESEPGADRYPFAMSAETLKKFSQWLGRTSDAVFAVRDGLDLSQVAALRGMDTANGTIKIKPDKHYAMLAFLQQRLISHLSRTAQQTDGVRPIEQQDIVHFRHIRVRSEYVRELQEKIDQVKRGKSELTRRDLAGQFSRGEITEEEFDAQSAGKNEATFKDLTIRKLLNHYYFPVVLGDEKVDYIQHIIKHKSEVDFLAELQQWLAGNQPDWDGWMFSKIDESLDEVYIPYCDDSKNEDRRFLPDFIFWMCRGNQYRIVFVDPKGDTHANAYHKIDGYKTLFVENGGARRFKYGKYAALLQSRRLAAGSLQAFLD